jgi:hypothetical protein
MILNVAGYSLTADIIERSEFISKITDKELEKIRIDATINDKKINERIIEYIDSDEKEITSQEGSATKKWKLIDRSYSYVGDIELVNYSWELEEIEEPKLNKLLLDDMEVIPEQYEEKFDFEDKLWAKVRVPFFVGEFGKIKELIKKHAITVVRQGINEKPRQMWLDLEAWSNNENVIKCQFSLFDYDDEKELNPMRPLWKLVDLVIKQNQIIDQLADLLIKNKYLEKEEYERIKTAIPDRNLDIEMELYRVSNLNDWKF